MFQSKDYIYEIYRCGSFSAAAKNLYITQPAISIAVKKEEQELGQPIFERSSSHLLLTDAGRAYIDAVEKLHRIEDDLKIYCNDLSNLRTGALRIGASSFFLSSIVLPVVAEYSRRRQIMIDGFHKMGLPLYEPEGAFYVFPCIKETGLSSMEFVEKLLEEQEVLLIPGNIFGAGGEGYIRCSYAYSEEILHKALERIALFVTKYRNLNKAK